MWVYYVCMYAYACTRSPFPPTPLSEGSPRRMGKTFPVESRTCSEPEGENTFEGNNKAILFRGCLSPLPSVYSVRPTAIEGQAISTTELALWQYLARCELVSSSACAVSRSKKQSLCKSDLRR